MTGNDPLQTVQDTMTAADACGGTYADMQAGLDAALAGLTVRDLLATADRIEASRARDGHPDLDILPPIFEDVNGPIDESKYRTVVTFTGGFRLLFGRIPD